MMRSDLAPKFYPVLDSPLPLALPCRAVGATAEGTAPRGSRQPRQPQDGASNGSDGHPNVVQ